MFFVSIIGTCKNIINESCEPTVPSKNWKNKDLYYKDMMKGASTEQLMKNVQNGKYKMKTTYPEPHRDINGRIIIENCKLYNEDVWNYGAVQAQKWVEQGKYNLTLEELKKENERIRAKYERLYNL